MTLSPCTDPAVDPVLPSFEAQGTLFPDIPPAPEADSCTLDLNEDVQYLLQEVSKTVTTLLSVTNRLVEGSGEINFSLLDHYKGLLETFRTQLLGILASLPEESRIVEETTRHDRFLPRRMSDLPSSMDYFLLEFSNPLGGNLGVAFTSSWALRITEQTLRVIPPSLFS